MQGRNALMVAIRGVELAVLEQLLHGWNIPEASQLHYILLHADRTGSNNIVHLYMVIAAQLGWNR